MAVWLALGKTYCPYKASSLPLFVLGPDRWGAAGLSIKCPTVRLGRRGASVAAGLLQTTPAASAELHQYG